MIQKLSEAGTHHGSADKENQDVVCYGNNKKYAVISLADGVSSCKMARDGARRQMLEGNHIKPKIGTWLINGQYEQLGEYLKSQHSFDDYSFISMKLKDSRRKAA